MTTIAPSWKRPNIKRICRTYHNSDPRKAIVTGSLVPLIRYRSKRTAPWQSPLHPAFQAGREYIRLKAFLNNRNKRWGLKRLGHGNLQEKNGKIYVSSTSFKHQHYKPWHILMKNGTWNVQMHQERNIYHPPKIPNLRPIKCHLIWRKHDQAFLSSSGRILNTRNSLWAN